MANLSNKYLYVSHKPSVSKFIGLWGILSAIASTIGMLIFLNLNIIYALIWGIPVILLFANRIIRYSLFFMSPHFDIKKHEDFITKFWEKNEEPSVDVFIPTAGEDINIVGKTLRAVKTLKYKNFIAYVLDDGKNVENSLRLKNLATSLGIEYLERPNKGEDKKAGNLQYGYDNSNGEFGLVLDADFIPSEDFLRDTIPYIASDRKIGILQTPQFFDTSDSVHRKSAIEFGGGNVVEDFYRFDMPARSRLGAGMCVGTSAIYSRKAILEAGIPKVSASEDERQGLRVMRFGYKVKYLPLVLSQGLSPDTIEAYFKQHKRWCTGSIETVLGSYLRESKLGVIGQIIYLSNSAFYLSAACSVLLSFHVFALLFFHYEQLNFANLLLFVPDILLTFVFPYYYRISKPKYGTYLAASTQIFTYIYSIPLVFINLFKSKNEGEWTAANTKVVKVDKSYMRMSLLVTVIFSMYLLTFAVIRIISPNDFFDVTKTGLLMFWIAYISLLWGLFIISVLMESFGKLFKNLRELMITPTYLYKYMFTIGILLIFSIMSVNTSLIVNVLQGNYRLTPKDSEMDVLALQRQIADSYFGVKTQEPIVVAEQPVIPVVNIDKSEELVPVTKTIEFRYIVEDGDTLSLVYRKIINAYLYEKYLNISLGERLYAESLLVNAFMGSKNELKIGQTIAIIEAGLENVVIRSKNLSNKQESEWNDRAQNVSFTDDFTGVKTSEV